MDYIDEYEDEAYLGDEENFEESSNDSFDEIPPEEEEDSKNVILEDLAKNAGKKKNYFDEELVKDLIVNKYQPFIVYGTDDKGKRIAIDRSKAPKDIEKQIMGNLLLIANAIINKYRYWRFEPLDDLQAEALSAMWKYLPNYVPNKGSTFDLFSLICKRHLLNYTFKNYRHRITTDVDLCFDISSQEEVNYDLFFENLEQTFLHIINHNYIGDQRTKYIEFTSILMEYLDKNKKIVGKNDLLAAFKEYGYKSTDFKKFIDEMSKYKEEFYR